ncbi:FG-GAP repeat protein, partial [bacterium]|nr:FG-GAP repeat protein [bacterium]
GARGLDRVYIMFGRRDVSWGKNFNLDHADVIISHEAAGSRTGWRVSSAGDVNGDGLNDILVSAPEYSAVGYHHGKVYLILGRSSGWPATFSEADASWYGEEYGDEAGYDVQTAGDFNHDALDDFVIGAWYRDANGNNSGKVYFVQGKRSGWQQNQNLEVIDTYFDGEGADQYAGFSCGTAGDLNGDGYDDFVSSSTYNGEAYKWGGKINIFLGHPFAPPPPTLFVSTNSISLGSEDSSAVFSVQNTGIGSFNWQISQEPADSWFLSAQPTYGELSAGESTDVHIQISRTGLAIGNYSGSLEITAPGAEGSPQTIQFDFDVPNTIPELAENVNQVEFLGVENGNNPAQQQITISNIGGGTLEWTAAVAGSPDWLILTDASGTDDSRITARVDITGKTPGTYSANISVQDPAAINSPLTIPISLVVREESVGPVLAEFEAETSASLPNSGWSLVTREESQGLEARISNIKIPPEANRLDFTFNVPEDVDGVWVFAELDVHSNRSDDSFWLTINDQNTCNWNNLVGLGNGWKRSWVYNLGKNRQQFFDVQPGENTLSLYPREDGTIINWLVVTTDNMTDIHNYDFNETPLPPPAPRLSLLPEQIQFSAIVDENAPESQSVQVLNAGGGELSWTAEKSVGADWLNLMNSSGVSGDLVELQVSTAGLPIGVYTTEVTFSDPAVENSPRILPVT